MRDALKSVLIQSGIFGNRILNGVDGQPVDDRLGHALPVCVVSHERTVHEVLTSEIERRHVTVWLDIYQDLQHLDKSLEGSGSHKGTDEILSDVHDLLQKDNRDLGGKVAFLVVSETVGPVPVVQGEDESKAFLRSRIRLEIEHNINLLS